MDQNKKEPKKSRRDFLKKAGKAAAVAPAAGVILNAAQVQAFTPVVSSTCRMGCD